MENGLDVVQSLKVYLIERKGKALEHEKHSTGTVRTVMTAHIQWIDALLIFLNSNKGREDMDKLELRLEAAVPVAELKQKARVSGELTKILVEFAGKIPLGAACKIGGAMGKRATVIASKIYALRENGVLPPHILPLTEKADYELPSGKVVRETFVYMAHLTAEELAIRKTKIKATLTK